MDLILEHCHVEGREDDVDHLHYGFHHMDLDNEANPFHWTFGTTNSLQKNIDRENDVKEKTQARSKKGFVHQDDEKINSVLLEIFIVYRTDYDKIEEIDPNGDVPFQQAENSLL